MHSVTSSSSINSVPPHSRLGAARKARLTFSSPIPVCAPGVVVVHHVLPLPNSISLLGHGLQALRRR